MKDRDVCPVCAGRKLLTGYNDLFTVHPEVRKLWNYDKNDALGIFPENCLAGMKIKVWWRCSNGHEWEATIGSVARLGSRCPYCSGRRAIPGVTDIFSTHPELKTIWNYEKNAELGIFPEEFTAYSSKRVWWKCKEGHDWEARIANVTNHHAFCPYCSGKKVLPGFNDLFTTNPELKNFWDYKKNSQNGIHPENYKAASHQLVWWRCDKGHEWQAYINEVTRRGCRCPYCTGRKVLKGYNDIFTTHPELKKIWNYKKNDNIGIFPEECTAGMVKKVWWKCENGHEWEARINSVANKGTRCPYCSGKRVISGDTDIFTTHPELETIWDFEKNAELGIFPEDFTAFSHKRVWWKCENGHTWDAVIGNVSYGNSNCPYCSGRRVLIGENDLFTTHPELKELWNYEKNNQAGIYPECYTASSKQLAWWKCDKGHEWHAYINGVARHGYRCPYCTGRRVKKGYNDLFTVHPELRALWNYEKNDALVYRFQIS